MMAEEVNENAKIKYPKSIFFIIATEFCERFSFYGLRTVLVLFFYQILQFSSDTSVILYHTFTALCYISPLMGAVLADSFFGKFRTIFYISILYAFGQIILTVSSIGPGGISGLPAAPLAFLGLLLIAIGTGGIKPCVASFGGEQFVLPAQNNELKKFFSLFYAAINVGSFISTLITPVVRQNVSCFNQDSCFFLAFSVPTALMVVSVVTFYLGKAFKLYTLQTPKENIILKTIRCLWESQRLKMKSLDKKDSFLDYSEKKYGGDFISDVKAFLNVCLIFLPFPLFWALFDQQGSRWIFQATRMTGETFGFTILPDQMQVVNPILILVFIPIFDYIIYPLTDKLNILKKPLQRVVAGGFLASLAFVISGLVELQLEASYPNLPPKESSHVTFYNGFNNCTLSNLKLFQNEKLIQENIVIEPNKKFVLFLENGKYNLSLERPSDIYCPTKLTNVDFELTVPSIEKNNDEDDCMSILISSNLKGEYLILPSEHRCQLDKSNDGFPFIKFLWNIQEFDGLSHIYLIPENKENIITINVTNSNALNGDSEIHKIKNLKDTYELSVSFLKDPNIISVKKNLKFLLGANYVFLLQLIEKEEKVDVIMDKITEENSLHMFLLLPQFIIMTSAEIMFSITSLSFAFTQAPESMKAVLLALRFLTNAFGNLLDVILISLLKGVFSSQSYEFFLFAALMALDMMWMSWLALRYKYVDYTVKAVKT